MPRADHEFGTAIGITQVSQHAQQFWNIRGIIDDQRPFCCLLPGRPQCLDGIIKGDDVLREKRSLQRSCHRQKEMAQREIAGIHIGGLMANRPLGKKHRFTSSCLTHQPGGGMLGDRGADRVFNMRSINGSDPGWHGPGKDSGWIDQPLGARGDAVKIGGADDRGDIGADLILKISLALVVLGFKKAARFIDEGGKARIAFGRVFPDIEQNIHIARMRNPELIFNAGNANRGINPAIAFFPNDDAEL